MLHGLDVYFAFGLKLGPRASHYTSVAAFKKGCLFRQPIPLLE